ncbi:OmpA family protein [Pedobacter namyangjuensis]|uniref:OmpA family protein n=1 Tax=Pedobacter namyangjuensis TaxID=600626 RepID=UPI000DE3126F|nr:OmpA family protein [Pedobacter namyangjuensis]
MKGNKDDFFWPSFADLMTSLFFIMLVLYIITFAQLKRKNKVLENQIKIIKTVEANLQPLKNDKNLFSYEEEYSRFKLAFDVRFQDDKFSINSNNDLVNPNATRKKIIDAGYKLKSVIDVLKSVKNDKPELDKVSYIVVIAGYASKDNNPKRLMHNYELSYLRALSLWQYWKELGIDFESSDYKGLVDLQISGNGWGGVGRLDNEKDNQRFLIQIFPKIGDIK